MTRHTARLLALVAVLLVTGPVGATAQAAVPAPDDDPFYAVPAGLDAVASGTVLRSRTIEATAMSTPIPAKAWQLLYRTVDNQGAPTATVATVMVPTAPYTGNGPRPVVSYQTAEDGVGTKCAPSYALRGGLAAAATNSGPETFLMQQAILRGWTVVAPDYEGPHSTFLGSDGEAREVLDGLRAARSFAPAGIDAAAPLGLWGYSGGALASSVAAQAQPAYAPELKLSAVALGGVVGDIRATIHAFSGSPYGGALIMGFVGVDRAYPEYHLTQYLNERAKTAMAGAQTDCITDAVPKAPFASLAQYTDHPEIIDGPVLKPLFDRISPVTFPGVPAAPVYDYHAIYDELAPIGPDRALMERFCRAGVTVEKVEDPLGEHLTEVGTGAPAALDFLGARFAGQPAKNTCAVGPGTGASVPAPCPAPQATVDRAAARGTRTRVLLRGRAAGGCTATAHIIRVTVSVARLTGRGRCAFLGTDGRLGAPRSCRRPVVLRARGTTTWTFAHHARLRPGRYRVSVQAIDDSGRRGRLAVVALRVR